MVLTFAAVLATADWFWVISLRGAVGASDRTHSPFVSWLQGSALLTPLFAFAVLAALALAYRWFGPVLRRPRTVIATGLLILGTCTLAGAGVLIVSGAYDLRLQLGMLDHMVPMGTSCAETCRELQKDATRTLQLQAFGFGSLILLVTNLLLVGWMVALRGGRLTVGKALPSSAMGPAARPATWFPEVQLVMAAGLVGTGTVLAVHAAADLIDSVVAALLLLVLASAQLAMAHVAMTQPGRRAWIATALFAVGLPALWIYAHSANNPLPSVLGSPGSIGLADGAVAVLEMVTLVAAVLLLSRPAWLRRAPASPHAGKLGLVGIVAVTAIGIGGSGLAMFNLGGVDPSRVPGNHHVALR
ncbi:MAG TPA: hypothetical protein VFU85_12255 [Nocardioides sp.]|nr:hypothetical protein [Nocardioides sp.]